MSKEMVEKQISDSINNLKKLVEIYCWNQLSLNYSFILSDSNDFKRKNFLKLRKSKIKINNQKVPQNLSEVTEILKAKYYDLYDVVFYIFKAKNFETIIEIEYYRKSNFDAEYFEKIKTNPPMFHSKIPMPRYGKNGKKIDINWHFGGLRHQFNTFIYDFQNRKIIREAKKKPPVKSSFYYITNIYQSYK
jgi:hypothetical protein